MRSVTCTGRRLECCTYDINKLYLDDTLSQINRSLGIMYMICDSCDEIIKKKNAKWEFYKQFVNLKEDILESSSMMRRQDCYAKCNESIKRFETLCKSSNIAIKKGDENIDISR